MLGIGGAAALALAVVLVTVSTINGRRLTGDPDEKYPVKLGDKTLDLSQADVIYDDAKGKFPHANTMTCKLLAGDKMLLEQEYYSVGGGFIEWKGYTPPKKGNPKYPYSTMKELRQHAEKNNISIAKVILANETSVSVWNTRTGTPTSSRIGAPPMRLCTRKPS